MVYGFDETPAPLWEFGLAENLTDSAPEVEESPSGLPVLVVLLAASASLVARMRRN